MQLPELVRGLFRRRASRAVPQQLEPGAVHSLPAPEKKSWSYLPAFHRLLTRTIDWEQHRIAMVLGSAVPDVEQLYAGTVRELLGFTPYVGPGSPSGGIELTAKTIDRIPGSRMIRYRAANVTFAKLGPKPQPGEVFPSKHDTIAGYLIVALQGADPRSAVPITWTGTGGFPIKTTGGDFHVQCGNARAMLELGL